MSVSRGRRELAFDNLQSTIKIGGLIVDLWTAKFESMRETEALFTDSFRPTAFNVRESNATIENGDKGG